MEDLIRAGYGFNGEIENIRKNEFARLEKEGIVYLDHTGATLYSEKQMQCVMNDLMSNVYGNPHSQNPSSMLTSSQIQLVRSQVLSFFKTSSHEYSVIFCSGSTEALRRVGEWMPWKKDSTFYHTHECHTSVLGIREYVHNLGGAVKHCDITNEMFSNPEKVVDLIDAKNGLSSVFAFPAQCNFSGIQYPLEWINHIHQNRPGVKVLLDAASFVGTSTLDLSLYPADFVTISFYKMFGYPTGLGALLVKKNLEDTFEKIYFGGGTIEAVLASERYHVFRKNIARFEDGTLPFLSILSLKHGFDILSRLEMQNIQSHISSLRHYLIKNMTSLLYSNGKPLCIIYSPHQNLDNEKSTYVKYGGTIAFNLIYDDGQPIGYNHVEKLATLSNIHLRTGCFCNPGACQKYIGLSPSTVKEHVKAGHVCWDEKDVIKGVPTGAVRISLGYMSIIEDCNFFLDFLKQNFLNFSKLSVSALSIQNKDFLPVAVISSLYFYPIKSCGGVCVDSWNFGEEGFEYDREWTVVDEEGQYLNQKKQPKLSLVIPKMDLENNIMVLNAPNMPKLTISIKEYPDKNNITPVSVCGDTLNGYSYGKDVTDWFTTYLGTPSFLIRREPIETRESRGSFEAPIGFANESPFLLISTSSLDEVKKRVTESSGIEKSRVIDEANFRPNIVVSSYNGGDLKPFIEDDWGKLDFLDRSNSDSPSITFENVGGCNRCRMICIDQTTGQSSSEPLLTLAKFRREKSGKILFGVHLALSNNTQKNRLSVGQLVNLISVKQGKE